MKKEFGFKVMFKSFVIQTVIAYIISLIVYLTGLFIQKGLWWAMVLFLIFIAILFVVVLKLINKKNIKIKTKPICNDCKGEECGDFCLQRK